MEHGGAADDGRGGAGTRQGLSDVAWRRAVSVKREPSGL